MNKRDGRDEHDERQILLDAKALISQQQYEAARRLLRPIAAHPTAYKWLETLDKIAPPPPNERIWDDDPLDETSGSTDEAEIGDPFAEPALDFSQSRTPPLPLAKPLPFSRPAHFPFGRPINPALIGVVLLFFTIAAMPMLCINWKRLGRPRWVAPSWMIGGFLMAAFITLLIFPIGDSILLKVGGLVVIGALFHVYLFSMYYAQYKAYEHVRKRGDVMGMLKHHYQWGPTLFGAGALVLGGIVFGIVIARGTDTPPAPIDSDYLTLERPDDWYSTPPDEAQFCHDYPQGCFLYVRHKNMNDVGLAFAYYPLNGSTPDGMASYLWQQYLAWYPNLPFGPRSTLTVDAVSVIFQEYTFPNRFSPDAGLSFDYAVTRGYVAVEGGLIEITFWSAEAPNFRAVYGDFEAMIRSIDLK
ncbi:MAG: hypothetical protein K8L91_31275 [Anaerolineae bacterium]|nr:hypothetical protein [Anaerolineae bacterium]